jgi:hypothetical protein
MLIIGSNVWMKTEMGSLQALICPSIGMSKTKSRLYATSKQLEAHFYIRIDSKRQQICMEKTLFDLTISFANCKFEQATTKLEVVTLLCRNDLIQPQVPGQFRLCDLKRNGMIAERFFDTFLNIEKFQIHDTYQGLIRANQILEKEKKRQYELDKLKLQEIQKALRLAQEQRHEDEEADHRQDDSSSLKQHVYIQRQRSSFEPFSLGAWCDYAEKEYDLLILNEQCGSVDSDWSARNNEFEEVEGPVDEAQEDNSSSDDHESDSSPPTTPVLQDIADDQQWHGKTIQEPVVDDEKWQQSETARKIIADDWIFS